LELEIIRESWCDLDQVNMKARKKKGFNN